MQSGYFIFIQGRNYFLIKAAVSALPSLTIFIMYIPLLILSAGIFILLLPGTILYAEVLIILPVISVIFNEIIFDVVD